MEAVALSLQARAPGLRNLHLELLVAGDAGDAGGAGDARFVVQHISSLEALQLKGQSRYGLKAALCSGIPKARMPSEPSEPSVKSCESHQLVKWIQISWYQKLSESF